MSDRPHLKNWSAERLIASGYRVVSRAFCTLSRIDRPDWKAVCKKENYPVIADWYRRCVSKDWVTVSQAMMRKIPNSGAAGCDDFREIAND